MMNYSAPNIPEINEHWQDSSVCLPSELWYFFLLSVAFVYYLMAVLSMIFTKESRRLRQISLLHDNLIMSILFPSLLEWLVIPSENLSTMITTIYLSPHRIQVSTCSVIVFLHSSLQTTSITALAYTMYSEKCLLPKMNCIKPKPVCSFRLLALEIMAGVTVTIATTLMGGSVMKEGSAKGCCLHPINAGGFQKTRNVIFSISSIYATNILLRVSVDRFLKLLVTGHQRRPKTTLYNRL